MNPSWRAHKHAKRIIPTQQYNSCKEKFNTNLILIILKQTTENIPLFAEKAKFNITKTKNKWFVIQAEYNKKALVLRWRILLNGLLLFFLASSFLFRAFRFFNLLCAFWIWLANNLT